MDKLQESSLRHLTDTKPDWEDKLQLLVGNTSLGQFMEDEGIPITPLLTKQEQQRLNQILSADEKVILFYIIIII